MTKLAMSLPARATHRGLMEGRSPLTSRRPNPRQRPRRAGTAAGTVSSRWLKHRWPSHYRVNVLVGVDPGIASSGRRSFFVWRVRAAGSSKPPAG